MLRLRTANVFRVFLVVVVLPLCQQIIAVSIAQLAQKLVGRLFGRAVAQWIHPDADRQSGERIVILGPSQHWPLIAQPPQVAHKHQHQQRSGADRNADLCFGKGH